MKHRVVTYFDSMLWYVKQ